MTDQTPNMNELWDDDENDDLIDDVEDFLGIDEIDFGNLPTVRILAAGRSAVDVPLPAAEEGQEATDTVINVLTRAGLAINGSTQVFIDGAEAGLDTVVHAGVTITPVGAVKGG